jgi:hypothetical protein
MNDHEKRAAMGWPPVTPMCELSTKDRLLVAIWDDWRDGKRSTYRELIPRIGISSLGHLSFLVNGLERQGMISREHHTAFRGTQVTRSLKPGPRFGGIYLGRPMRIIRDDDAIQEEATRIAKWDRRSALYEVA